MPLTTLPVTLLDGTVPVAADFMANYNALNNAVPITAANGGTGATTLTSNGVLLGNGTSAVSATSAGAAYQPLRVPSGGGAPAFGALDLSQSAAVTGALAVGNGGTGQTSYTNGQLLIGNTTGNTLAQGTLTDGGGVDVTNGAGAITLTADVRVVASSLAEATTTSSSAATLHTLSSLSIPTTARVRVTLNFRKSGGAAEAMDLGLRLNGSDVGNRTVTPGTDSATSGRAVWEFGPQRANYLKAAMFNSVARNAAGAETAVTNTGPNGGDLPNATITEIIIRANNNGGVTTCGVSDVIVEVWAGS